MPQVANASSPAPPQRLMGYARVSTDNQLNDAQVDELRAASSMGPVYPGQDQC